MKNLYEAYVATGYSVTTDSRAVKGGEMFFAIRGENFDGNRFAMSALEAGAACAVVCEDAGLPDDPRLFKVADTLQTLKDLAVWHRKHVLGDAHLPVIGLTGTNGKTTTKELIRAVLSAKYSVTATEGNLNNDIGVPLSILKITPNTQIAVIEMGANHPDDIEKLVCVSQPDYGLITNVGKAHLLGFGSFEGVKAAKSALYRWLGAHKGVVFINEDDADLRGMATGDPCHNFGYGLTRQNAEILPLTAQDPFLSLRVGDSTVRTRLVGSYNAANVLAALAVGEYFGVPRDAAIAAIEAYAPSNNRSQLTRGTSNTLIVDAYNANPSSMMAALDNFCRIIAPLKVAMLGDMRELGEDSVKEHVKIVWRLVSDGVQTYLVGDEFRKALEELNIADSASTSICGWFATSDELASFLKDNPLKDAVVLVKGSRGIQMEKVLESLL